MSHKVEHNKKVLLQALEKTLGVVTTACELAGVGRTTYYEYYNDDKEFKAQVDDLANVAIDCVESQLFKRIQSGDTTAMIFYLKTKAKDRGYVEKQLIDQNTNFTGGFSIHTDPEFGKELQDGLQDRADESIKE